MGAIEVFEPITEHNFDPERYGMAHPEVSTSGLNPQRHYAEIGRAKAYGQITAAFMDAKRRRARFARFCPGSDPEVSGRSATRFMSGVRNLLAVFSWRILFPAKSVWSSQRIIQINSETCLVRQNPGKQGVLRTEYPCPAGCHRLLSPPAF